MKNKMVTEKEVLEFLGTEVPEINNEFEKMAGPDAYKALHSLAGMTKKYANTGNIAKLKDCFRVADNLISKGNNVVKCAVENAYVFSISSLLEITSPFKEELNKMLPKGLKSVYRKQIVANYP